MCLIWDNLRIAPSNVIVKLLKATTRIIIYHTIHTTHDMQRHQNSSQTPV